MSSTIIINISLEIFASIILAIILGIMLFDKNRKNTLNHSFIKVLICCLIVLQADIVSWIFDGNGDSRMFPVMLIANFCVYAFSTLGAAAYNDYIIRFISTRARISKAFINVINWVCWVQVFALVISQFNHMFYFIDETNHYCRGDWYYMVYIIPTVIALFQIIITLRYRKELGVGDTMALLSYNVLLFAGTTLQAVMNLVMLLYIFASIGLFIVYIRIQVEQAKKQETELINARIDIMLSQIQPHFLYNSLATIQDLVTKNPTLAREAIVEFSVYLRGNMDSLSFKELIPFEKELNHVENFLALEQKVAGGNLKIIYEIGVKDFKLPALALQPIIENAVRHGIDKKEDGGTVTIKTEETETSIRISIIDDGVGFDPTQSKQDGRSHIGIKNVENRLNAMCKGTLHMDSTVDMGTTAIITIPKGGI